MTVWFERVELDYGRHAGSFRLVREDVLAGLLVPRKGQRETPAPGNGSSNGSARDSGSSPTGRPFVILGPNGAGKSTLIEAPVRALFGFRRNTKGGRVAYARRQPWVGGPYRALVVVRTPEGRITFERDFETDRIRVTEEGRQSPMFDAEANPARSGESVRRYRAILRDTIGLDDFGHYRDTACVFQGGLLAKNLSGDLLRVAAGGHADVDSAHARLRKEYAPITVEPIAPGVARRRKPGSIEKLSDEIEELSLRSAEAKVAEERRTPLVRAREECLATIERLSDEGARLEAAFETLSEGDRLETEVEATRARIRALGGAERQLDEAFASFNLVVAREETHPSRYPEDFASRASALEELWPRIRAIDAETAGLSDLEERPDRVVGPMLLGGAVVALLSVALVVGGFPLPGVLGLIAGLGAAGYGYARGRTAQVRATHRAESRARLATERAQVGERIEEFTSGLPDHPDLGPETLAAARREFEGEVADRRLLADAEATLRQAIDAGRRALELHRLGEDQADDAGDDEPRAHDAGPAGSTLADRARGRLDELKEAIAAERDDRMAPLRLQLNEIARARFDLPDDVDATLDRVRAARRERLEHFGRAQADLAEIERGLATEGRVTASALSLDRDLAERRELLTVLEARAVAYRHAYGFVTDAYDAFRTSDEERLLSSISGHIDALSGGALGPLEAEDGLDTATLRAGEMALPLASPPLSYGQLHAALLSVRMGAADFLAGLGVGLPLLIDDPFVHLDERAVADLWTVLCRIAGERQVVVGTQDRLVLDHLGVVADIELEAPLGATASASRIEAGDRVDSEREAAAAREGDVEAPGDAAALDREENRVDEELLDLWGDPPAE